MTGKQAFGLFAFGVACWCGGGALAYSLTKTALEEKHEQILDQEIEQAKRYYARKNKTGDFADPTKLAEGYQSEEGKDLQKAVDDLGYSQKLQVPQEEKAAPQVIEKNVFDESVEEHNKMMEEYEEYRQKREMSRKGFIISADEFLENEIEYEQATLTYFQGDDVLADDKDEYIRDADAVVGDDNLNHFGFLSKDNNILYIRNDRLKTMYEVVHSSGEYKKEVLGFIEHTDRPGKSKLRKFKE